MRHNSTALDAFVKVMKVTNYSGLWDSKLTWYFLNATHWICLYGLKQGLRIHGFIPPWLCLIIMFLIIQVKFLKPSGYWTVISCSFIFQKKTQIILVGSMELWSRPAHWPSEWSVRKWSGRHGFNPRSRHTKNSKNCTWCNLA